MTPLDGQAEAGQSVEGRLTFDQVIAVLENNPGSTITAEGHLFQATWTHIPNVVTPAQAALIMQGRDTPSQGAGGLDWVSSNLETLRALYRGKWIAVKNSAVIGSSPDLADLLARLVGVSRPFITFIPAEDEFQEHAYGNQVI